MIRKEDYEEPACLLCNNEKKSIPVMRVTEKLDEYLDKKDFDSAQRHLNYWLAEARSNDDQRGEFSVLNEMMGLYRKLGKEKEAVESAQAAVKLGESLGIMETAGGASAYVNAATVFDAFGYYDTSIEYFQKAKPTYEAELKSDDSRLGALYNNMAICLSALQRYSEACHFYEKALEIMGKNKNGELEQAVTYLNMADAKEAELGPEDADPFINEYLEKAQELLDKPGLPHGGYYAFFAEKCAPVFDYYGWFIYAKELYKRSAEIYKTNQTQAK